MTRTQVIACRAGSLFLIFAFYVCLWLSISAFLTGCTPAGFCDPSQLCHPDKPLALNRPVLLRFGTPEEIDQKRKQMEKSIKERDPTLASGKSSYFAFTQPEGPWCQAYLPYPEGWSDTRFWTLLWHELRHCGEGAYHA